ncbi:MAG: hypothetical protein ABII64_05915 [Elusimicrobiota bacterium]
MRESLPRLFRIFIFPALLLLLTLFTFRDVLVNPGSSVLSKYGSDMTGYFVYSREFGFNELKHGNLPLWNPHVYSGTPFLANFQSALFYPLNFIFFFLPVHLAINWSIILHVYLMGLFAYFWGRRRSLSPPAAFFAGALIMFSGSFFMRVYPGHLTVMAAMAWIPLVFLSLDALAASAAAKWYFIGIFSVVMQILSGHSQYVYYTGVAALIYSLFYAKDGKFRVPAGLFVFFAAAAVICAVQLLPAVEFTRESIRGGKLDFAFASSFSFPPENLLTFVVPGIFGDLAGIGYWGRSYLWEATGFFTVTGFVFAVYGFFRGDKNQNKYLAPAALILLVLALGKYTPLYKPLYQALPFYGQFRGSSKFIIYVTMFLAMVSASGFESLLKKGTPGGKPAKIIFITAILFLAAGLSIKGSLVSSAATGIWAKFAGAIGATGETPFVSSIYSQGIFIYESGIFAYKSIISTVFIMALLGLIFQLSKRTRLAAYAVLAVAAAEALVFSAKYRPSFDVNLTRAPQMEQFIKSHPGDYRMLILGKPNVSMSCGAYDIFGSDTNTLKRYSEFIAFTQGENTAGANQYLNFSRYSRLFDIIRCKYVFLLENNDMKLMRESKTVLPHVSLVRKYELVPGRDEIFKSLSGEDFNFAEKVLLENQPPIEPGGSGAGNARVTGFTTDSVTIEAETKTPSLLLITDIYSTAWKIRPVEKSAEIKYQIIPADYILMAVPLAAGKHKMVLEYMPDGFIAGKYISAVSAFIFIAAFCYWAILTRKRLH